MELFKIDQLGREAKPASSRKINVGPLWDAEALVVTSGSSATVLHLSVWQHFISHAVSSCMSLPFAQCFTIVQEVFLCVSQAACRRRQKKFKKLKQRNNNI